MKGAIPKPVELPIPRFLQISISSFAAFLGFLFAVYAVTANDSIQTLGTYISSNRDDVKWYWMFAYMGSIFVFTMFQGFMDNDPAFGRLNEFPEITIKWYHAMAPLVLIVLTRLKIPVSTTFLVLSVFAAGVDGLMEKMLMKSFLGYAVSFVFAFGSWYLITKYILYEGEKGKNNQTIPKSELINEIKKLI